MKNQFLIEYATVVELLTKENSIVMNLYYAFHYILKYNH